MVNIVLARTARTATCLGISDRGHAVGACPRTSAVQGTTVPVAVRERAGVTGAVFAGDASIQGTSVWRPPIC